MSPQGHGPPRGMSPQTGGRGHLGLGHPPPPSGGQSANWTPQGGPPPPGGPGAPRTGTSTAPPAKAAPKTPKY
ncbi:hypothetical protein FRC08_006655, partial [Ceratobasidium sp. 394]